VKSPTSRDLELAHPWASGCGLKGLKMVIKILETNDKKPLFDFEKRNKDWFEEFVPPRPFGYFNFDSFSRIIDALIDEQKREECFLFVIYENKEIIGRVNISEIDGHVAEIGYRICKDHLKKGLATKSVKQLIQFSTKKMNITELSAKTTAENIASQNVLLNNGFKYSGKNKDAAELNGHKVDLLCYSLKL